MSKLLFIKYEEHPLNCLVYRNPSEEAVEAFLSNSMIIDVNGDEVVEYWLIDEVDVPKNADIVTWISIVPPDYTVNKPLEEVAWPKP